jgi:hypothetical protein
VCIQKVKVTLQSYDNIRHYLDNWYIFLLALLLGLTLGASGASAGLPWLVAEKGRSANRADDLERYKKYSFFTNQVYNYNQFFSLII